LRHFHRFELAPRRSERLAGQRKDEIMIRKCIAAALLAAGVASPALATDFTFDLPVSVRDVPLLTQVRASCYVSVLPAGVNGAAGDANVVGRGSATVDAPAGTFEGTITVPVENGGTRRSVDARSYGCELEGLGTNASGAPITLGTNWSLSLSRMIGVDLVSQDLYTAANLP
jgi:hypothetical protein